MRRDPLALYPLALLVVMALCCGCSQRPVAIETGATGVLVPIGFGNAAPPVLSALFSGPVARGAALPLVLVREGEQDGAVELSLNITGGPYRLSALGAAQWLVWFDAEGDYRLDVMRYGAVSFSVPRIEVRPIARLRIGAVAAVRQFGAEREVCSVEIPIEEAVLAPNNDVTLALDALDAAGRSLLGVLDARVVAVSDSARVDALSLFANQRANQLRVRPALALSEPVSVSFEERTSGQQVTLSLPVNNVEMMTAACMSQ